MSSDTKDTDLYGNEAQLIHEDTVNKENIEEIYSGTSSVRKIISTIERQISTSYISIDLSSADDKRKSVGYKADVEIMGKKKNTKNANNDSQVDQQTAQSSSKSNLVNEKDSSSDFREDINVEDDQITAMESKVDVEIKKESILIKNDNNDIQVDQQTAQSSSKSDPTQENNSSSDFREDLNVEGNQTKTSIYNANVEIENMEVINENYSNEIHVDQQTTRSSSKSNPTQEKDSSSVFSKNLNIKEDQLKSMEYKTDVKIQKENVLTKNYNNDIQVNQQTAQSSSKSNLVQEKDVNSEKHILDSSTIIDASIDHDDVDSSRIPNLDVQCETREQRDNSKIKYEELLKLNQKITNNNKIWYILLAVILGIFVYHHISMESDNKQLKIQLDRAHISMEDLNKKIRSIEDENKILHDKLYHALAKTGNHTFDSEIIRITTERDTLELKLQEAVTQIRLLQTKLDHALSENNYLQAHVKEGNTFMNKESPEKSKEEDNSIDWLSSMQSFMGYCFNLPILILFSFIITFLNLTCSVLIRDKLSSKLLKIPAIRLRSEKPTTFTQLHFFSCILAYPFACELVGLLGWFTGFSVSKTNMLNLPKPIGLMVRSGEDIMSDWVNQDNALIIWLVSIITGGMITFIQFLWYNELNKRLNSAQLTKHQILLTSIGTLIFLNLSLYRIFSWATWRFIGVNIGPITFVNWLGARKAVSKILSFVIYSILPLFALNFLHKKSPNLIRNIFNIFKNVLIKSE